jgi:hypothetical protein
MSMSEVALDAETGAKIFQIVVGAVLKDVHDSINAIGGGASNEHEEGINFAVGRALEIIEAKMVEIAR